MDTWKEPIYRHEKKAVSPDFKCGSQGKQWAWPEKLKSVTHRLNSILSHEKRIKQFTAGWKAHCVRIVCNWPRHWHTKYHSARKSTGGWIIAQVASAGPERVSVIWQVIYGQLSHNAENRKENVRQGSEGGKKRERADWERRRKYTETE